MHEVRGDKPRLRPAAGSSMVARPTLCRHLVAKSLKSLVVDAGIEPATLPCEGRDGTPTLGASAKSPNALILSHDIVNLPGVI